MCRVTCSRGWEKKGKPSVYQERRAIDKPIVMWYGEECVLGGRARLQRGLCPLGGPEENPEVCMSVSGTRTDLQDPEELEKIEELGELKKLGKLGSWRS